MQQKGDGTSEFNGYIFIDPRIEVGDKVLLDKEYVHGKQEVIVVGMGKLFATIRHNDMQWCVMLNRLTAMNDWEEDFSHENGNYYNTCCHCEKTFIGHKRRVSCKKCSKS